MKSTARMQMTVRIIRCALYVETAATGGIPFPVIGMASLNLGALAGRAWAGFHFSRGLTNVAKPPAARRRSAVVEVGLEAEKVTLRRMGATRTANCKGN